MANMRPPTVTLKVTNEKELRTVLKDAWCRNPEQNVREFRENGVTKFLGSDGDGWPTEIVVRKK